MIPAGYQFISRTRFFVFYNKSSQRKTQEIWHWLLYFRSCVNNTLRTDLKDMSATHEWSTDRLGSQNSAGRGMSGILHKYAD